MDVTSAIKSRRSVRSYTSQEINDEVLKTLLEAARLAPSGGNRQSWKFIAVRNPRMIRNIKMFSEGLSGNPTLVIGICSTASNSITFMDIAMASENIMLQCVELGLGSCAIASFNQEAVKKLLGVPEEVSLPLLLSIGYPAGEQRVRPKKELREVASLETYNGAMNL